MRGFPIIQTHRPAPIGPPAIRNATLAALGSTLVTNTSAVPQTYYVMCTAAINLNTNSVATSASDMPVPANYPILVSVAVGESLNIFSTLGGQLWAIPVSI